MSNWRDGEFPEMFGANKLLQIARVQPHRVGAQRISLFPFILDETTPSAMHGVHVNARLSVGVLATNINNVPICHGALARPSGMHSILHRATREAICRHPPWLARFYHRSSKGSYVEEIPARGS